LPILTDPSLFYKYNHSKEGARISGKISNERYIC
jgi:hypothetical protein